MSSQSLRFVLSQRRTQLSFALLGVVAMFVALLALAATPTRTAAQTVPTFSIVAVSRNQAVQIRTANFPASTDFVVRMGPMGTRGINGTAVATVNSGSGGTIDWSFAIPTHLAGSAQIAVRLESANGFFAYNWFFNNNTAVAPQPPILGSGGTVTPPTPTPVPPTPAPPVTQFPTMAVSNVVRNQSATARLFNLSPNTSCTTQMGPYGSQGFGFAVGSFNTNAGGTQDMTFTIPSQLVNSSRIAIRLDCANGTFAFNWFYNNTATVPVP